MKKRILAFILAFTLLIHTSSTAVYAAESVYGNTIDISEDSNLKINSNFETLTTNSVVLEDVTSEESLFVNNVSINQMESSVIPDKKLEVTLSGNTIENLVEINEENFPDDAFRNYLLLYDTDNDGIINPATVTIIDVFDTNVYSLKGIEFFSELVTLRCGVNQLTELDVSNNIKLQYLECHNNLLSSLDVSKNTELINLECSSNNLSEIDISNNTKLLKFYCSNNQLTEIDVTKNTLLHEIYCHSNQLTEIDLSKNVDLWWLDCYNNQMTNLDTFSNPNLYYVRGYGNNFTHLDFSKNLNLKSLSLNAEVVSVNLHGNVNEFETFDIPCNYDVVVYCDKDSWISNWCMQNHVPQMNVNPGEEGELLPVHLTLDKSDVYMVAKEEVEVKVRSLYPEHTTNKSITWSSSNTSVATVDQNGKVIAVAEGTAIITALTVNNISASCNITVSNVLPLDYWYFPSEKFRNYLSENYDKNKDGYLSQSERDAVKEIILAEDEINSGTLKGIEYFSNLEILSCRSQGLLELDVSNNINLKKLDCTLNFISELDVSQNKKLLELLCGVNDLREIDVRNNLELTHLWLAANKLKEIDVSKNTKLIELNVGDNQLTSLDVTNNNELGWLYFFKNAISEIDITKNTKLCALYFNDTLISEIDLRHLDLAFLVCNNTKLKELDISNQNLLALICSGNEISELDLSKSYLIRQLECTNMLTKTNIYMWNSYPTLDYFIIDSTTNIFSYKGTVIEDICKELKIPFYSEKVTIALDKKELELTPGEATTLVATISPENVDNKTVTWSSSNEKVAVVDENGVITAIGKGTADIIAKTYMGTSATCKVNVYEHSIQNLQIVPKDVKLLNGESEQLRLIINPLNATDKSVYWSSSDENIVTVDQNGKITAVSAGSSIITVKSSNQVETTCNVTVEKTLSENNIYFPQDIIAVTNIHSTLKDVRLPEGWKWVDETISLKYFSGVSEKMFEAVYQKEGYREVIRQIPVKIVTISKVNVIAPNIMEKGKETPIYAEIITNGLQVPETMVNVEWISSEDSIISLNGKMLTATATGKKAGNAKLSAKVIVTDGEKETQFITVQKKVMVTEQAPASIIFEMPEGFVQNGNVYSYKYTNANEEAAITLQVTGTEKITLKSSDAKVASVSKATKDTNGKWNAILTIRKPGYIKLTAVADDALTTGKSIELYIKDAAPNINTSTIELNYKNTNGAFLSICPNNGYVIEKVYFDNTLENSDKFNILREENTDNYKITLSGNVEKGTYKQKLKVLVDAKEYEFPITVKVINKDPAVTVKQSGKANLFYKNSEGAGTLNIFSDEKITDISLIDCDFSYSFESRQLICTRNWDAPDKKGTLVIQVEGYKDPLKKNITISTEKKAPKIVLSAKTASLYPIVGIETARVNITDISNGAIIQPEEIQVTFKPIKGKAVTAYNIQKNQNEIIFTRTEKDFKTKVSADILIQKKEYAAPIKLTYAINVNEKLPALTLDKKTVILNKAIAVHEYYQIKVYPKDTQAEDISQVRVTPADAKSKAEKDSSIAISVQDKNTLAVRLNDVTDLKTGNYKFNIDANYNGQKCQKTVLTVKIVDTAPNKTVKVTSKGSIDLLNRDTTCIYYTPKISNITGEIVDVSLSGRSAHLFKAELEDGKIKVSVTGNTKEEQDKVALVTKYKYGICLKLIFDNGLQSYEVTTDELKITLKQTKPKVTIQPKQSVMFNTLEHRIKVEFKGVNKDKTSAPIKKIELTNFKNVFFFDEKQNEILLTDKCSVVKGKTYTLKFNIYFEGCGDNEKPVQVNYKVKIQ